MALYRAVLAKQIKVKRQAPGSASHRGQAHSGPRKRERQREKVRWLGEQAASEGMSVGEFLARRFSEVGAIIRAQSQIRESANARASRSR